MSIDFFPKDKKIPSLIGINHVPIFNAQDTTLIVRMRSSNYILRYLISLLQIYELREK